MRLSLRNEQARVRDGWKSVFFILAAMACFAVVGFVGHALPAAVRAYAPSAILITVLGVGITWAATRLEGASLASIGLKLDGRFLREWGVGTLAGMAMIAATAVAVCALAGVRLSALHAPTAAAEAKLVVTFLGGAIFEELLFRGYPFQRAMRGLGTWPAILVFAALFCLGHVPGNLDVGAASLTVAMANIFTNGIFQSQLLLRTRSLALPIGLHFGWNLLQQALGFGVSGIASSNAWFQASLGQEPGWLTGGGFGLEASVFALAMQVVLIVLMMGGTGAPRQQRALAA